MKRLLSFIIGIFIMCSTVFGQSESTLKFLGIPVDGSKSEMVEVLKSKGFEYDSESDFLIGDFNGKKSEIGIVENHGKVYRVVVFDANTCDEGQIKIRFNNLIHQFENNDKYFYIFPNDIIPEDEDIHYEILVNKKKYIAEFRYNPLYGNDELRDRLVNEAVEEHKLFLEEKKDEKAIGDITYEEFYSDKDNYNQSISSAVRLKVIQMSKSNNSIWFTIFEHYGKYYISLYYDNLLNAPNGEDL